MSAVMAQDPLRSQLDESNHSLQGMSAEQRVAWGLEHLPGAHALSSSFGAQSAVALHLLTRIKPDVPVILIDTGYLFAETYRFVEHLQQRLDLNLRVYRPDPARAWSHDRVLTLQTGGVEALQRYNHIHKVEPMQRALAELGVQTWFAGLRRSQSRSRADLPVLAVQQGRWKINPLADWSDRDIGHYLRRHDLPWHPLWEQGYVSIGDWHSSRPLNADLEAEDTRFFGLKRECGLHEPWSDSA